MCLGISISLNCFLISSISTLIVLFVVGLIGLGISISVCNCDEEGKSINKHNHDVTGFQEVPVSDIPEINKEENSEPKLGKNPSYLSDYLGMDLQSLPANLTNILDSKNRQFNPSNLTDAVRQLEEIKKTLKVYQDGRFS